MNRFLRYACLLLLALWLPATLHCNLEALNLMSDLDGVACCETGVLDHQGICDEFPHTFPKPSPEFAKAPAPSRSICELILYVRLVVSVCGYEQVTPFGVFTRPLAWVPVWHFARRAAPSPRAPSVLV